MVISSVSGTELPLQTLYFDYRERENKQRLGEGEHCRWVKNMRQWMFLHKINQTDESMYSWMKNVQMSSFQLLKKNRRVSDKCIQCGFWKCFITSRVTDCSWPTEEPRHPSNEVKAWKSPEPPLQVFTWQHNRTQTHLSLHQLIYSFADLSMHSCTELLKIEQQPVAPAGYMSWGQH